MPEPEGEPEVVDALVIGGGPAGLMAAEALAEAGRAVLVAEAKPTVGRKLLMAGKSGLNLTKAEPAAAFAARLHRGRRLARADPRGLRASRGRRLGRGPRGRDLRRQLGPGVSRSGMKASPLLRAWLGRLEAAGVALSHPLAVDGLGRAGGALRDAGRRRAVVVRGPRFSRSAGPRGRGSGRTAPGRRSSRRRGCRWRRSGRRTSASASPGRRRWRGTSARRSSPCASRPAGAASRPSSSSPPAGSRAAASTRSPTGSATARRWTSTSSPAGTEAAIAGAARPAAGRGVAVEPPAQGARPVAGQDRAAARVRAGGPRRSGAAPRR